MKIQLPKDPESKRCVLIVIENHVGVMTPVYKDGEHEYVNVLRYTQPGFIDERDRGLIVRLLGDLIQSFVWQALGSDDFTYFQTNLWPRLVMKAEGEA